MPTMQRPDTTDAAIDVAYAQRLQCQRQWRGFLKALGQEFAEALPAQELTALMARIGLRFAVQHPLSPSETLAGLQQAMNVIWESTSWGEVELSQSSAGMEVRHRFSPLVAAFGDAGAAWPVGFLQGVYQQWFDAAGAGGLQVQTVGTPDALGNVVLRLSSA